ncbi:MAG: putative protein kinase, partial [Streblomastix strix]
MKKNVRTTQDQTIIFFDWDDTLLASSVLCGNQITLQTPRVPTELIAQFAILQQHVIQLLETALLFTSHIFIITNAERGWVELSAEKFMPRVFAMLQKISNISARAYFQASFPNQPNMWKKIAFIERISHCFPNSQRR